MESARKISDLARDAAVPVSTVRYYERAGLILPDERTDANYRLYGDGAVERLRFIRAAQAAGFTLRDIKVMLELKDGHTIRCKEIRPLVETRLSDVEMRIGELEHVRGVLHTFLDICRKSDEDGDCGVINRLDPVE